MDPLPSSPEVLLPQHLTSVGDTTAQLVFGPAEICVALNSTGGGASAPEEQPEAMVPEESVTENRTKAERSSLPAKSAPIAPGRAQGPWCSSAPMSGLLSRALPA